MEIEDNVLKKMQTIQLKMAEVLLDFCKQHGLTIWAGYGTLLGAVRHKGFIPWDDDMDFVMLREDFNKLRQLIATETLPAPLAFDGSRVDVIKVKNCNTTQVATPKITEKDNFGIWVDIWCLDSFPKEGISDNDYTKLRTQLRIVSNAMQMSYSHSTSLLSVIYHTYCLVYTVIVGTKHMYNAIETTIKQVGEGKNCELLVNILLYSRIKKNSSYSTLKKYERRWFEKTVMLPFEGIAFPCPADYDRVLTVEYGDYMIPVKGAAVHNTMILDVDRPYMEVVQEYLHNLPWYKRIINII